MTAASERMPVSIMLTGRYPFGPGFLPVWATRWMLQPAPLTIQPTHWHCQRRAQAGTPANLGHPLASPYSKTLPLVGPAWAGPQGPPVWVVTSLQVLQLRMEEEGHPPLWPVCSLGGCLCVSLNWIPQKWPAFWVAQGWFKVPTSWQDPQCSPPLGESVLEDQPADALCSSLKGLDFATAGDCPNVYGHQNVHRK